eukprot:Pgem_evm1s18447
MLFTQSIQHYQYCKLKLFYAAWCFSFNIFSLQVIILKHLGSIIKSVEDITKEISLVFWILYEMFIENDSFYDPYFALIPTLSQFDFPLFATAKHKKTLDGHVMKAILERNQQDVAKDYNLWKEKVFDVYTNVFPEGSVSKELFFYALSILKSRKIMLGGEPYIVPMLDMVNFGTINSDNSEQIGFSGRRLKLAKNYIGISTDRNFEENDQLLEDFGEDNMSLLQHRGFVVPRNQKCALLSIEEMLDNNLELIKQVKKKGSENYICVNSNSYENLISIFRIQNPTHDDPALLLSIVK